ncbi:MAG: ATP-binding protein [Oscillospiraceae bacterium]|nr:ATP-binding protein [Oscillospiraceae bacterium]
MNKKDYKPRIVDKKVKEYLQTFGAVCIEGPKWCGKTWTSSYHSNSEIKLGDPAGNFQNRQLAQLAPEAVLEGENPRLIDEWQEVPPIWDAVRHKVDQTGEKGQFILTGSSTPNHKGQLHSGAGRIAKIRMHPMSLYESGDSSGKISLEELCNDNIKVTMTGDIKLTDIINLVVRGGWPGNINTPAKTAGIVADEYLKAIIDDDAHRLDGIKRNTAKMNLLLRSLARNESTTASKAVLKKDIKEIDSADIDDNTISDYLNVFQRLFLIDNQPPFATKIRSSVRVKQAEKRHFADPSLACALLKATPEKLLNDLETLGFLFEALCERDLKIYAESFGAKLYHYQDYKNREIDAVIEMTDGRWAAFEIKLGANQIDTAASNLIKIRDEIAAEEDGVPPSVLCVLCGLSTAAYKREDGVYVVPITALKD